jgi:hypothetical protein
MVLAFRVVEFTYTKAARATESAAVYFKKILHIRGNDSMHYEQVNCTPSANLKVPKPYMAW